MKKVAKKLILPIALLTSCASYAAQPIDLNKRSISQIKSFITPARSLKRSTQAADQLQELKRNVDFNGTTHIRVQQTHHGYPVFGANGVVHVRKAHLGKRSLGALASSSDAKSTDMSGQLYQGLDQDLQVTPASVFTDAHAQSAQQAALQLAQKEYNNATPAKTKQKLMVYIDDNHKAHWAFLTTFYFPKSAANKLPARPHYILDAQSFKLYTRWNDIENLDFGSEEDLTNASLDHVDGGGMGGNPNMGRIVYDGLLGDFEKLDIERNASNGRCYLMNDLAVVRDGSKNELVANFPCKKADPRHNSVYWDGKLHRANGGYSPDNDTLYAGSVIKSLYQDWYNLNMLTNDDGTPMKLSLVTHAFDDYENAFWDSEQNQIYIGDGADYFYPLTSLGVIAHEVSHGFTQQHSDLVYHAQSGALNESFSDMAAQAAEQFAYGNSSWTIGAKIVKDEGGALRYLDQPSKDCASDAKPGENCSIDSMGEYKHLIAYSKYVPPGDKRDSYVVHLASGVFNRAFYLLATAQGWDAHKAFGVMIQANSNYWTPTSNFEDAACGVLKATKDYGYDNTAVLAAFKKVAVDTSRCLAV